jgi:hypothetical protein
MSRNSDERRGMAVQAEWADGSGFTTSTRGAVPICKYTCHACSMSGTVFPE